MNADFLKSSAPPPRAELARSIRQSVFIRVHPWLKNPIRAAGPDFLLGSYQGLLRCIQIHQSPPTVRLAWRSRCDPGNSRPLLTDFPHAAAASCSGSALFPPPPMPSLATTVDGLKLPNPFIIASGPPGTNLSVINRAFREGWGAVIAKTVSLDALRRSSTSPRATPSFLRRQRRSHRLGKHRAHQRSSVPALREDEFKKCKDAQPPGAPALIASIMEGEYNRDALDRNRPAL